MPSTAPKIMSPVVLRGFWLAISLLLTACSRPVSPVEKAAPAPPTAERRHEDRPGTAPSALVSEAVKPALTPPVAEPAPKTYVASSEGKQGEVLYPPADTYLAGIEQHIAEMKKRGFLDKPPIAHAGPEAEIPGCNLAQHYPYGHERRDGGLVSYSSVFRCSEGAYLIVEEADYGQSAVQVSYTPKGQPNSRVNGTPAIYTNLRDPANGRVMQSLRWQRKPRTYNIVYVGNAPLATHTLINLATFIGRTR